MFTNRINYTKSIHDKIKLWVAANIDRWKDEKPKWFRIEEIPDEFLPSAALEAEGGARHRRRSSTSLRGMIGVNDK